MKDVILRLQDFLSRHNIAQDEMAVKLVFQDSRLAYAALDALRSVTSMTSEVEYRLTGHGAVIIIYGVPVSVAFRKPSLVEVDIT